MESILRESVSSRSRQKPGETSRFACLDSRQSDDASLTLDPLCKAAAKPGAASSSPPGMQCSCSPWLRAPWNGRSIGFDPAAVESPVQRLKRFSRPEDAACDLFPALPAGSPAAASLHFDTMNIYEVIRYFCDTLVGLLAIVDPVFAIPTFVTLFGHLNAKDRGKRASRVALYVAIILLTVLGCGSIILNIFGISLGGIRIAGGLIIASIDYQLLNPSTNNGHDSNDRNLESAKNSEQFVFIPLAFPTLAGPASMAAVIELSTLIQERHSLLEQAVGYAISALAILSIAAIVWSCSAAAPGLLRN